MFPAEKKGEWEPYKVLQRRVKKKFPKNPEATTSDDAVMGGTAEVENEEVEEIQYYEDRETDEGAVWPIVSGYIVNWSCFFALLTHIYNTLSPTLKSPMVIAVQPAFTLKCREKICQFLFEKFKIPGLYLIDAASAAASAFNIGDAMEGTGMGVIVDVGYDKCDVTAMGLHDPVSLGRLISIPNCGGRTMTNNLHRLLGHKGFTYDMCEQLKRSSICEILPVSSALPAESNGISQMNPAAAASTGMNVPISKAADTPSGLPRGPGPGTEAGDEKLEENEGVLDVASIVASGKTSEILAKKEREKAEKAAKKAKAGAANDSKSVKLPNFQKAKATFYYDEPQCLNAASGSAHAKDADATATATLPAEKGNPSDQARPAQPLPAMVRKEVEVGAERFQADGPNHELIWIIADSIKRCVSDAPVEQRSAMWENIMVVGNGSKIKGQLALPERPCGPRLTTTYRLQRVPHGHAPREVPDFTLFRNYLHLGATLRLLYPNPYWRQHAKPSRFQCWRVGPPRPWRQSPPSRRHPRFKPLPRAPRTAAVPTVRHAPRSLKGKARVPPDADEHQVRQSLRLPS